MDTRLDLRGVDDARAKLSPLTPVAVSADFPTLLERVPAIIYVADAGERGRWHYLSPQIQGILGYSPEEWCADPGLWAERLHDEDRERVLAAEARGQAGKQDSAPTEYRLRHRAGHVVWIRDDAVLVR